MEIQSGMPVYSKAGHDKGRVFVVLKTENNYAYIADGDTRKIDKPKKKKLMHLQKINEILELDENLSNKALRQMLAQYKPI